MALRYLFAPFGALIYACYLIGLLLLPFALFLTAIGVPVSLATNLFIGILGLIILLIVFVAIARILSSITDRLQSTKYGRSEEASYTASATDLVNYSREATFKKRVESKINYIEKFRREYIKIDSLGELRNPNQYQKALISLYLPAFALLVRPVLAIPALVPFLYHITQVIQE